MTTETIRAAKRDDETCFVTTWESVSDSMWRCTCCGQMRAYDDLLEVG